MTDESRERRLGEVETREADVEMPRPTVVRHGVTFRSFRYRDFSLFFSGALLSNVGTWMQNYALAIVVYSFRRSEFDLGIVNFVAGVPVLLLSLFAGAVADRLDRRRLIIAGQWVALAQAATLGYLYGSGHLSSRTAIASLLWVAALGLVGGVVSALTFPSWQSLLPDLVPKDLLLNAIALNSAQFQTARLLGPLAASGLVLLGAGMGEIFYVNAASFLFVIAALMAVRPRPPDGSRDSSDDGGDAVTAWRTLTAGIRYAREHQVIGTLILSTGVMTVFGMPYMMLLPAIVDKALHGGKLEVSYLMAANGLGAVVGALLVASLPKTVKREPLIPVMLFVMASLLVGFSFSRALWLSLALSVLAGAAVLTVNSLANTSIQATVPPRLRGRVMALFITAFLGLMPLSSIIFGSIGQAIGPTTAVFAGALVLMAWAVFLIASGRLAGPDESPAHART